MFDELKKSLEGCVYTIFTPFDADLNIDYEVLERYLAHLYGTGARKFYAMAYNSRYSQLTDREIMDLNEFCIRTLKKFDSANVVIVGDPIHCSTAISVEFARHAREAGADLISLLVREKYFSDDQVLDHFAEVGRLSRCPILVHEMPFLSGADGSQIHWPESLLNALPTVPEIVALKEDAKDFEVTCAALELEPRIRVVISGGGKERFVQFKKFGARSYLNGISMLDARIGEIFWKAFEKDDHKTISFIIEDIEKPFFDFPAQKHGWHRTNKALLQAAGLMHRRDRMPLKHLSDEEFADVEQAYLKMKPAVEKLIDANVD